MNDIFLKFLCTRYFIFKLKSTDILVRNCHRTYQTNSNGTACNKWIWWNDNKIHFKILYNSITLESVVNRINWLFSSQCFEYRHDRGLLGSGVNLQYVTFVFCRRKSLWQLFHSSHILHSDNAQTSLWNLASVF